MLTDKKREAFRSGFDGGYKYLPVELFKTETGYFVFDSKNVCFLKIDRTAFDMLSILREGNAILDELIALLPKYREDRVRSAYDDLLEVQADGLLIPYHFQRVPKHNNSEYKEVLSERMRGFTVFITTRCNLGCPYCIYSGQYEQHEKLTQGTMPWGTVKSMMQFLQAHSRKSPNVCLNFFGGEPLLAFEMIKRGVEYLKGLIEPGGPEVFVAITSNGTVMTDKILNFLLEHDVYLQFSIDGDQESHDLYRIFKSNGRGSFETIINNLQKIYNGDPEYFRRNMRLKGVITTETLDHEDRAFFEHPLIRIMLSEGHYSFLEEEPYYDLAKDTDYFDRLHNLGQILLRMDGVKTESDIISKLSLRQGALYRHTFGRFFGAQITNQLYFHGMDSTPFTKGCLVGYREGAVLPNGDILICLKSAKGRNFIIGNVNEGRWYYDKIRELNTIFHRDWAECYSCYIQKICDLCYEKLSEKKSSFTSGRSKFCEFNRAKYRVLFDYMLRVAENNQELWQYLDHVIKDKIDEERQELARGDTKIPAGQFGSHDILVGKRAED